MSIILFIYLFIGFLLGLEILLNVEDDDDSSLICIGVILVIVLWPLYLLIKLIKRLCNRN